MATAFGTGGLRVNRNYSSSDKAKRVAYPSPQAMGGNTRLDHPKRGRSVNSHRIPFMSPRRTGTENQRRRAHSATSESRAGWVVELAAARVGDGLRAEGEFGNSCNPIISDHFHRSMPSYAGVCDFRETVGQGACDKFGNSVIVHITLITAARTGKWVKEDAGLLIRGW